MSKSKIKFNFSDDFLNESSSDEEDVKVKKNRNVPGKQKRSSLPIDGDDDTSSEDEFELEMKKDLDETMKNIEIENKDNNIDNNKNKALTTESCSKSEEVSFYDQIYFDSDEDEENSAGGSAKKSQSHPVISNDDLFYDPNMDDEDQKWVDKQRLKYQPQRKDNGGKQSMKLPNSDAILNCPCCMVLLCLDCQRHTVYNSQYRAMFVTNCKVIRNEVLKYPLKNEIPKNKKRKNMETKKKSGENLEGKTSDLSENGKDQNDDEVYHPVNCTFCNTEVAVFDKDEVFHFFNVLASHA